MMAIMEEIGKYCEGDEICMQTARKKLERRSGFIKRVEDWTNSGT